MGDQHYELFAFILAKSHDEYRRNGFTAEPDPAVIGYGFCLQDLVIIKIKTVLAAANFLCAGQDWLSPFLPICSC